MDAKILTLEPSQFAGTIIFGTRPLSETQSTHSQDSAIPLNQSQLNEFLFFPTELVEASVDPHRHNLTAFGLLHPQHRQVVNLKGPYYPAFCDLCIALVCVSRLDWDTRSYRLRSNLRGVLRSTFFTTTYGPQNEETVWDKDILLQVKWHAGAPPRAEQEFECAAQVLESGERVAYGRYRLCIRAHMPGEGEKFETLEF